MNNKNKVWLSTIVLSGLFLVTGCGKASSYLVPDVNIISLGDKNKDKKDSHSEKKEEEHLEIKDIGKYLSNKGNVKTFEEYRIDKKEDFEGLKTEVPKVTVYNIKEKNGVGTVVEMDVKLEYHKTDSYKEMEKELEHEIKMFSYPNSAYLDTPKGRVEANLEESSKIGRSIKDGEIKQGKVYFFLKDYSDLLDKGNRDEKIFWRQVTVGGSTESDKEEEFSIEFNLDKSLRQEVGEK